MPVATITNVGKPHPTDPSLIGVEIVPGIYGWDAKPTHSTTTLTWPGYTEVDSILNRPSPSGGALPEGYRVTTTNSKLTWTVFGGAYRPEPDDYDTVWTTQAEMLAAGIDNAADFVLGVKGYPLDTKVIHDYEPGGFVARPAVGGAQTFTRKVWQYDPPSDIAAAIPVLIGSFSGVGGTTGDPPFGTAPALAGDNLRIIRVGGQVVNKSDDGTTYFALNNLNTNATQIAFSGNIKAGDIIEFEQLILS